MPAVTRRKPVAPPLQPFEAWVRLGASTATLSLWATSKADAYQRLRATFGVCQVMRCQAMVHRVGSRVSPGG